jgi:hypothetical protein
MTITPEAPIRFHDLQVRTDPAGTPLAIRHDGQIWLVDPATDTQHWYGRDAWWDTRRTAAVGSGDLVSVEYWRVQAQIPRLPRPAADLHAAPPAPRHAVAARVHRRRQLMPPPIIGRPVPDEVWEAVRAEFALPTVEQVRRRLAELMEDPAPVTRQLSESSSARYNI